VTVFVPLYTLLRCSMQTR